MQNPENAGNGTKEAALSGNASPNDRKIDRRVRRTRDALGDALVALMQEKPFAAITVQEVLDRAQVGRSTFYQHFRDKEDLFISDADEFFEMMSMRLSRTQDPSDRVALAGELFAHVGEMGSFVQALRASGLFRDVIELAQGHFARGIERRLAELARSREMAATQRAAMAHAHAGALFSLLQWWLDRGMRETPAEMDALFHRMVWGQTGQETQ